MPRTTPGTISQRPFCVEQALVNMSGRPEKTKVEPFQFEPTREPSNESADRPASENASEQLDLSNRERMTSMSWCTCANCVPLPTEDERLCCHELAVLDDKINSTGIECITCHPKFNVTCLDEDVLRTALTGLCVARCNPLPDPMANKAFRLIAYRMFTWWAHGILGARVRKPLPSCVISVIRATFPEQNGIYEGFKYLDL